MVLIRAGNRTDASTYASRVDSNTIVLVIHLGIGNCDTGTITNIKSIGVVTSSRVTSTAINDHVVNGQAGDARNADSHERSVQDVEVIDSRRGQVMSIEELGLDLSISALAVPPSSASGVQGSTGTINGDARSGDAEERTGPFFVAPGGGSLEDNLGRISKRKEDAGREKYGFIHECWRSSYRGQE